MEVGQIKTKACKFKVQKQVEAAFAADACKSVQECVAVIGRDVFDTKVNWLDYHLQLSREGQGSLPAPVHQLHAHPAACNDKL